MENELTYKLFELGYYPEDLPPEFCVHGISEQFINDFINNIDTYDVLGSGRKTSDPIQFSIPKNNTTRRWFHLINPLHFLRLANTIQNRWVEIESYCEKSVLSTSRIIISEDRNILFKKGPFRESIRERVSSSAGKKFVLTMDITSFYPSIYTHSLEWIFAERRLNGKERFDRTFPGVALDQDIRIAQSGKTNGIVIGPETSRIISEIIASHIDRIICNLGVDFKGTRYVDDYHLYFNNLTDLEAVRLSLQTELNKLNLSSNEAKTEVNNVPEVFEQNWVQIFQKLTFRKTKIGLQNDLVSAFSLAIENSKTLKKDFSLKFLISMLLRKEINYCDESKSLLTELLRHSIEQDARTMSRAFQLMYKCDSFGSKEQYHHLFYEKLLSDSQLGKTYEVLWILHGYCHLEMLAPDAVVNNSVEQEDVLSLTYLLYMSEKGLISDESKIKIIDKIKSSIYGVSEPYLTNYWMVLYEGTKRGWWDIDIEMPAFIKQMMDSDISFLKSEKFDWHHISVFSYPEVSEYEGFKEGAKLNE